MAVGYIGSTYAAGYATPDPLTVSFDPGSTDLGAVVVFVEHRTGDAAYNTTGADVTYGGTALVRQRRARDTAGEPGSVAAFFGTTGLSTGAQTVSWNHDGGTGRKHMVVLAYSGTSTSLGVQASGILEGDQANPQISLDSGSVSSLRAGMLFTGLASSSELTLLSGQTDVAIDDVGNNHSRAFRTTAASTGAVTVGFTAGLDDVAMVALAIGESVAAISSTDLAWYYSLGSTSGAGGASTGNSTGSLGGQITSTTIATGVTGNMFDDVSSTENAASESEYRLFFVANNHASVSVQDVGVWVVSNTPTAPSIALSVDTNGVTSKTTTATQSKTITDEDTAPASQTFSSTAVSEATKLGSFTLDPGECQGIWFRRTTVNSGSGQQSFQVRFEGTPV